MPLTPLVGFRRRRRRRITSKTQLNCTRLILRQYADTHVRAHSFSLTYMNVHCITPPSTHTHAARTRTRTYLHTHTNTHFRKPSHMQMHMRMHIWTHVRAHNHVHGDTDKHIQTRTNNPPPLFCVVPLCLFPTLSFLFDTVFTSLALARSIQMLV